MPTTAFRDTSAAMSWILRSVLLLAAGIALSYRACGDEKKPYTGAGCAAVVDDYFKNEVWGKVGATSCLTCHKAGGDAENSKFILLDPSRAQGQARDEALRHNRAAFARVAQLKDKDQPRILQKVVGGLKHGGA